MNKLLIYSVISFLFFVLLYFVGKKINLVDVPSGRKKNYKPVTTAGGLAVCVSLIFSLWMYDYNYELIL